MARNLTDDEIVEKLVFCFHIYPNYRVDSRGPAGLLMDIIEDLRPDIAQVIRDESADEAYSKFFSEEVAR